MKKIKKRYFFILLLTVSIGVLAIAGYEYLRYGSIFEKQAFYRNLYKAAIVLKKDEKYKGAYYTFAQIAPRYDAYDAVLFQQADCASKIEDEATAIKKLKLLLTKFPSSIISTQANYELAKTYMRLKEYDRARGQFEKIIKNTPGSDFAIGSYYYLGQIAMRKDKNAALEYWKKYIALSPKGRFAYECINLILSTNSALTPKEKYHLAIALYFSQRYEKAIKYLEELPFEQAWYYLAKSYIGINYKKTALKTLKKGIKKYTYTVSYPKLKDAMQTYVNISTRSRYKAWDELSSLTRDKKKAEDIALYNKTLLLSKSSAYPVYERIYEKYKDGDFASEALWHLFWREYNNKNYQKAKSLATTHSDLFPDTNAAPKILYWLGKISEKEYKKSEAKKYYKKLMKIFPDSYYSFRANGRLNVINGKYDTGWETDTKNSIAIKKFELKLPYTYDEVKKRYGSTYAELLLTGDFELISYINDVDDKFIQSWLKYKDNLKSKSIVIARNEIANTNPKPKYDDAKWQFVYPIYFSGLINKYAKINKLDPYIVLSLAREESYFNNMAVSSSNARGLMQLLPTTAKDIARWNKLGRVNDLLLFNPETNIKLGTAYLKYAENRFNGQTVYAVGSYNGGPAAVQRWVKTLHYADTDEFIEQIPYDQTRNYIKKVYRSYWNYKQIYKF